MQRSGVPIGGPISGAILFSILAFLEHLFDLARWYRLRWSAVKKLRGPRKKYITTARYADDILMLSRWFCVGCLVKLIKQIYRELIGFDPELNCEQIEGWTMGKFLDMWVFFGWEQIKF